MPLRRPRTAKAASSPQNASSLHRAFDELRELIVRGNLPPGAWIVEAALAERLGFSRTPIRGALHWLRREGYVVEQAGARKTRIMVAPLTREDARELYRIVAHLEVLAGGEVVALPPRARTKLADELTAVNAELSAIASTLPPDPRQVFDLDKEFHTKIIATAGGKRLGVLYQSIRPQVDRYWRLYASSIINALPGSVAEHAAIIAAIRAGDAAAVRRALDRNWTAGYERISGLIEMFGERGSW